MQTFTVSALWDEKAGVYYCESDIHGLHIEAPTIEEFVVAMHEYAPQMIVDNHLSKADQVGKPIADLIPSIVFNSPSPAPAPA
jgi:hypothetical protein